MQNLIPGLPDHLVSFYILPRVSWWDFLEFRVISRSWKVALDYAHPLKPRSIGCCSKFPESKRIAGSGYVQLGDHHFVAGGHSDEVLAMDGAGIFFNNVWEDIPCLNTPLADCIGGYTLVRGEIPVVVMFGGILCGESFLVESAQGIAYGEYSWTNVEESKMSKAVQNCCFQNKDLKVGLLRQALDKGSHTAALKLV